MVINKIILSLLKLDIWEFFLDYCVWSWQSVVDMTVLLFFLKNDTQLTLITYLGYQKVFDGEMAKNFYIITNPKTDSP